MRVAGMLSFMSEPPRPRRVFVSQVGRGVAGVLGRGGAGGVVMLAGGEQLD